MKIAIIIPARNEEKRIGNTLQAYSHYFEELRKQTALEYEITVVINATSDRTEEITKVYEQRNPRIRHLIRTKLGKGYGVIEGFKDALTRENDVIGFVDADMATSPDEFIKLVREMKSWDGAIASRYIKGSIVKPRPSVQRIFSNRIYNFLIRALFFLPYRDTQCGAKVFTRKAIYDTLPVLEMSKWAFDTDLLYHLRKKGYCIREVPTRWEDKEYSTINFWKAGPIMALAIIRLRIANSPLKRFIKLYDTAIEMIL